MFVTLYQTNRPKVKGQWQFNLSFYTTPSVGLKYPSKLRYKSNGYDVLEKTFSLEVIGTTYSIRFVQFQTGCGRAEDK